MVRIIVIDDEGRVAGEGEAPKRLGKILVEVSRLGTLDYFLKRIEMFCHMFIPLALRAARIEAEFRRQREIK